MDPAVSILLSVAFALLLGAAALHKLTQFREFRQVLSEYQLLPATLVGPAAIAIVGTEVLLASGWAFRVWLPYVGLASSALLLVYAVAIGVNLRRGRVFIDCGCAFGRTAGETISAGMVIRNVLLAGVSIASLLPLSSRALGFTDALLICVSLIVLLLLYATASQLLRNDSAIRLSRNVS